MILEGDTIRASGTNTLVDLWLVDRVRPLCVTREAIAANVGFAKAEAMGEEDRCRFVRSNLTLVLAAATAALLDGTNDGDLIVLDGSALVADGSGGGDRRTSDRRNKKRRQIARTGGSLATGERRRSERRVSDRRRSARPTQSV